MRILVALFLTILLSCVSTPTTHPTLEAPLRACAISCGFQGHVMDGYIVFQAQHRCGPGQNRWFTDIWLTGEISDHWIACDGPPGIDHICKHPLEYAKVSVEFGTCKQLTQSIQDARQPEERGQYPGEDSIGGVIPPKK